MKIDPDYQAEHVLRDGSRATLRWIRPEDAGELRRAFGRLSATSRYRRFLTQTSRLSDEMLRYLTEVDGTDHVAIVATRPSLDLKSETGLGVGRFVRLAGEPHVADAAITVADDVQGLGLGRLLLEALGQAARERGIHTFRGDVLGSNAPMRHILEDAGAVVRESDGETLVFDIPLGTPEGHAGEAHPLRRLLRAVARGLATLVPKGDSPPPDQGRSS